MMTKNKTIAMLVLTALLSIIVFADHCSSPPSEKIKIQSKENFIAIDLNYKKQIKVYAQTNETLVKRLQQNDSLLNAEKIKVGKFQKQLNKTLNENWNLSVGNKSLKCDTLLKQVAEYQQQQEIKDSITENKIVILSDLILLKDSQITDCNKSYQCIRDELEYSFKINSELTENLNKQLKKEKRRYQRNKLLRFFTVIAATAATTVILIKQ